jgi:hypothetical protein
VEFDPDFTKVDKEMLELLAQTFYATKYNMESTELIFKNSQFLSGNQRASVNLHFPKSFKKYEKFEFNFLSIFSTASICMKILVPPQ